MRIDESTRRRAKSLQNLMATTMSCPQCGKAGHGSKIGSGDKGTKCKGKIREGDTMVACTHVFRGAHFGREMAPRDKR